MYQDVVLVTQELVQEGVFVGVPDPKGALACTPGVQVGPAWVVLARFPEGMSLSGLEVYATQEDLLVAHPEFAGAFAPIQSTDPEGNPVVTQVSLGGFFDESADLRRKRQRLRDAEDALLAAEKKALMTNPTYKAAVLEVARARKDLQ